MSKLDPFKIESKLQKHRYNPNKYKGEKPPKIKHDDIWYNSSGFPIQLQQVNRDEWVMLKVVPQSSWYTHGPTRVEETEPLTTEEVVNYLVSNRCYT